MLLLYVSHDTSVEVVSCTRTLPDVDIKLYFWVHSQQIWIMWHLLLGSEIYAYIVGAAERRFVRVLVYTRILGINTEVLRLNYWMW